MGRDGPRETDLYPPVKAYLEAMGFEVKGEVASADVVAMRPGEDPVVVELKTGFSLALFHQGVERQAVTDWVYLAVPRLTGRRFQTALRSNIALCRRLGLGLLTVRLRDGLCEPHLDPAPYRPRKNAARKGRLIREFARRVGDPNTGGSRGPVMTAYRQDALRCLAMVAAAPTKASVVAAETGVVTARRIMSDDHYGWFERVERGVYAASPKGRDALEGRV
ncbi:MAG: DUF2161 family putative PD-(D/E)XK-type phosphodiesterase [Paracoccaceae bacterium]|nr:DUF2161 family putative PD-(D/E)XK-type phosphodiesterase [Paracoccaceae bacterium]